MRMVEVAQTMGAASQPAAARASFDAMLGDCERRADVGEEIGGDGEPMCADRA